MALKEDDRDDADNPERKVKLRTLESIRLSASPGSQTSPSAMLGVLRAIDNYAGKHGVWTLGVETIAAYAGLSLRAARRAIAELKRQQLLIVDARERARYRGGQGVNGYRIVWPSLRELEDEQNHQYRLPFGVPEREQLATGAEHLQRCHHDRAPGHGDLAPGHGDLAPGHGDRPHNKDLLTAPFTAPPPAPSWVEAEGAMRAYGVEAAADACQSARERGCSPGYVLQLVEFALSQVLPAPVGEDAASPGNGIRRWGPGALHRRVKFASPGEPVEGLWPPDSEPYRRAKLDRERSIEAQRRFAAEARRVSGGADGEQQAREALAALPGPAGDVLRALEPRLPFKRFALLFWQGSELLIDADQVTVLSPNPAVAGQCIKYRAEVESAVEQALGQPLPVVFRTDQAARKQENDR